MILLVAQFRCDLVVVLFFNGGSARTQALEGRNHGFHQPEDFLHRLAGMPVGEEPFSLREGLLHNLLRLLIQD